MADFAAAREKMVERQIAARGINDSRILGAFRTVPREAFVPDHLHEFAFEDSPLPIEADQTISQPYIVALMIEAAELEGSDLVLEVGAGSGYAAAVIAQVADEVIAIERHAELAKLAGERLERLGYENVSLYEGDGTRGFPDKAPFDAIIVSASGSHVPEVLLLQLEIGGRLVMPIGEPHEVQKLLKVTRIGEEDFEQEELGAVRFVPLIGAHAWDEKGGRSDPRSLPELIRDAAEPLPDLDAPAFGALFDRFADARVVLLGEASHGTSEFYRARAAITRRLIEEHGFTIVAVEADWPDAASVDRYVRGRPRREGEESPFQRFPTWMWRNTDVDAFIQWLKRRNDSLPQEQDGRAFTGSISTISAARSAPSSIIWTMSIRKRLRLRASATAAFSLMRKTRRAMAGWRSRAASRNASSRSCRCFASCSRSARNMSARRRRISRRRGQCPARQECGGLLPPHVSWRRGELESARHAHVRNALPAPGGEGAGREGRGLGA
jgi:protein-L-isoaspartate(D-aspartate) O-methyltransferase